MTRQTVKTTTRKYDAEGRVIEETVTETTYDYTPGRLDVYPQWTAGPINVPCGTATINGGKN